MDCSNTSCKPCRIGAPTLTNEEIDNLSSQIPGWKIHETDGIKKIQKNFRFKDFAQALAFTNSVGNTAESEGHHPVITLSWGGVTVTWHTHKIKGLHRNDIIMAAKTDSLYQGSSQGDLS